MVHERFDLQTSDSDSAHVGNSCQLDVVLPCGVARKDVPAVGQEQTDTSSRKSCADDNVDDRERTEPKRAVHEYSDFPRESRQEFACEREVHLHRSTEEQWHTAGIVRTDEGDGTACAKEVTAEREDEKAGAEPGMRGHPSITGGDFTRPDSEDELEAQSEFRIQVEVVSHRSGVCLEALAVWAGGGPAPDVGLVHEHWHTEGNGSVDDVQDRASECDHVPREEIGAVGQTVSPECVSDECGISEAEKFKVLQGTAERHHDDELLHSGGLKVESQSGHMCGGRGSGTQCQDVNEPRDVDEGLVHAVDQCYSSCEDGQALQVENESNNHVGLAPVDNPLCQVDQMVGSDLEEPSVVSEEHPLEPLEDDGAEHGMGREVKTEVALDPEEHEAKEAGNEDVDVQTFVQEMHDTRSKTDLRVACGSCTAEGHVCIAESDVPHFLGGIDPVLSAYCASMADSMLKAVADDGASMASGIRPMSQASDRTQASRRSMCNGMPGRHSAQSPIALDTLEVSHQESLRSSFSRTDRSPEVPQSAMSQLHTKMRVPSDVQFKRKGSESFSSDCEKRGVVASTVSTAEPESTISEPRSSRPSSRPPARSVAGVPVMLGEDPLSVLRCPAPAPCRSQSSRPSKLPREKGCRRAGSVDGPLRERRRSLKTNPHEREAATCPEDGASKTSQLRARADRVAEQQTMSSKDREDSLLRMLDNRQQRALGVL
uniref:Uncharacterized protein n=1 Tax=Noctiluca scintillans TaxID=2966 RepID=A0A7S1F6U1_NOCSC